ncbi:hypothetical protein BCR43DRAFT_499472 [Syncephalastrum racemosum]|uniref:Uncharacterized protein n=1 Tax=Syncephalastrum racemosum TaxID=13706 RepID=A0A1X2H1L6_SYNRA|nr:hypothetical protein BCR43DRAFT_499472 [Syncephalastrum racemosum]
MTATTPPSRHAYTSMIEHTPSNISSIFAGPLSSPHTPKRRSHRYRHPDHHRRDAFQLLQTIIQENERIEREEYEAMLRDAPEIVTHPKNSRVPPSILVKHTVSTASSSLSSSSSSSVSSSLSPSTASTASNRYHSSRRHPATHPNHSHSHNQPLVQHHHPSVRFATGPPKVFQGSAIILPHSPPPSPDQEVSTSIKPSSAF